MPAHAHDYGKNSDPGAQADQDAPQAYHVGLAKSICAPRPHWFDRWGLWVCIILAVVLCMVALETTHDPKTDYQHAAEFRP